MVYHVALIGHSQLPTVPDYEDVRFTVFKVKGAHVRDLWDPNRFDLSIFTTHWDCAILFIGGMTSADIAMQAR